MNRFHAFAIHFGISLAVFAVLAYLVLNAWYPEFFFETDGGWQGIRIIIAVDLVLGPLLTLIVFKPGKPGLKTDLAMIGTLQVLCLIAGTWIVYSERPVALVYVDGYFYSISAGELRNQGHPVPDFDGAGPHWMMVDIPADPYEQSDFRREARDNEVSLRFMSERYVPFDAHVAFANWQEAWKPIDSTLENRIVLDTFIADVGGAQNDYRFVPFGTRYAINHLVFRMDDDSFVGLVLAEPT